jgi:diguanylate cyclase (GGDEF)-like protein
MPTTSSPLKRGGFAIALAICLSACVPPLSLSWVDDARIERHAAEERIVALDRVETLLVNAETGQRGYVITGQDAYLEPYRSALRELPAQMQQLHERYASRPPAERALIDALLLHAGHKLDELQRTVHLRRDSGLQAALAVITEGHGARAMADVRRTAARLRDGEFDERNALEHALNTKIWRAMLGSLISSALSLGLLVYLALTTSRAMRARELAARQARETSEQLSEGVATLRRRNEEISTLAEMSRVLQTQMSLVEGLEVSSVFCRRLMPGTRGAIYLFRNSADLLERSGQWGDGAADAPEMIEPSQCWGLRRGQLHCCEDAALRCRHLPAQIAAGALDLCLPLVSYGEVLGLLQVHAPAHALRDAEAGAQLQTMSQAIAEQVALTLSNAKLRQVLRDQSIRDPLTGLYNRRYMEETLSRELARAQRAGSALALVVADLDHFKKINDTHGHPAGDKVLRAAAQQLAAAVRASDVACRFGGEEFVLILPDCSKAAAIAKAQQLCERLRAQPVSADGQAVAVTASFGVAALGEDGVDAVSLFEAADRAVYAAKRAGRDRVVAASESPPPARPPVTLA